MVTYCLLFSDTIANQDESCVLSLPTFGPVHTVLLNKTNHHEDVDASITFNAPFEVTEAEEYVKFTFRNLWSNIGGYLGLFLGVSLLQISDLFTILQDVCSNLKKK